MFSLFKKKPKVTTLDWLGADIHNHIIPGIDDGSPDVPTSLSHLQNFAQLGFHTVISTPHIFKSYYNNSLTTIQPAFSTMQQAAQAQGLSSSQQPLSTQPHTPGQLRLGHAAEYMLDEDFNPQTADCLLPNNHILVEMSYMAESPHAEGHIYALQVRGLQPILAHPERYTFYIGATDMLFQYQQRGVLFQLNLLSITGYYGKHVQKQAKILLDAGLYTFAGTDLHHGKHMAALKHHVADGSLYNAIGSYTFLNNKTFG